VKERDTAAAAIDTKLFAGVQPPPMQAQVQRMGGISSAVVGGFCEHSPAVHELVAKFADKAIKDVAEEHG
jgi:L-serine deaminase